MNLNLLSYLLFFPAMLVLAVGVAQTCHKHGRLWMLRLFDGDADFVDAVNNILLVCCYMINLGYIALVMADWERITSIEQLLGELVHRMAIIILALAGLHYQNIAVLLIWSRIKQKRTIKHARP
jgi:hypothetical protein